MSACTLAPSRQALAAVAPPAALRQRPQRRLCPVRAEKGFGGGSDKQQGAQNKVGKRGKTSSRPDPQKTLEQLQAEQAGYESELSKRRQQGASSSSGGGGGPLPSNVAPPRIPPQQQRQQQEYGSSEAIPEPVTNRMLGRVILFSGTPVFLGICLLPFFYYLKVKQDIDLPTWVVYIVQTLTFGGGLLGITYGITSASWDPRREGSLLGWDEFRANLPLLMDRFKRN